MLVRRVAKIVVFTSLCVFLFFFFQNFAKFHFLYMEQFQLFQFNSYYFLGFAQKIGGMSIYIGNFLTQFYIFCFCGPFVSAVLLSAIAWLSVYSLKKIGLRSEINYIGIIVIIPLIALHLHNFYNLAGTVSLLLLMLALSVSIDKKGGKGLVIFLISSLILFWVSGSVSYFYLLTMIILNIQKKNWKQLLYVLSLTTIMVSLGFLTYRIGWVERLDFVFLMGMFYEPKLQVPLLIYFPLFIFVSLLIVLPLVDRLICQYNNRFIPIGVSILSISLVGTFTLKNELPKLLENNYLKELDYYSKTGQWDKIIEKGSGTKDNYLYMNYINLALLNKGLLVEEMFSFDQRNNMSLLVTWDKTQLVSMLTSDIAFATGQIALAQNMAFEALVNYQGSVSGRCLKRLIETNLIYGEKEVAEKYLDILDQTLFYRDWAEKYRVYINDRELLEEDTNLKLKIESLPTADNLIGFDPKLQELINCVYTNPNNKNVIEFTEAYMLVNKDINSLQRFIETFYGTPVLPNLPKSIQEAVIIYSESDPSYWLKYGVSKEIINRFSSFKDLVLENKNNSALAVTVNRYFGDTFWYYYMFKS